MQKKKALIFLLASVFFGLTSFNIAQASYYGVYDIRDIGGGVYAPEKYPELVHFDWVDNIYTYNSSGDTFSINVIMYAPNNWNTPSSQNNIDYNGYKKEDESYGATMWMGGDESFNNVYSYFYQVENQSATAITDITIPYTPAAVEAYGLIWDGSIGISEMTPDNDQLNISFGGGLSNGATSDWFFMTSQNWWGWQPLSYNSGTPATGSTVLSSIHSSPDGMIPAPNPEAPTVAFYVMGLIGMLGFVRMKFLQRN